MTIRNTSYNDHSQGFATESPPVIDHGIENDSGPQEPASANTDTSPEMDLDHRDVFDISVDNCEPNSSAEHYAGLATTASAMPDPGFEIPTSYIDQMDISDAEVLPMLPPSYFLQCFTQPQLATGETSNEVDPAEQSGSSNVLTSSTDEPLAFPSIPDTDDLMRDSLCEPDLNCFREEPSRIAAHSPQITQRRSSSNIDYDPGIPPYPRLDVSSDEIVIMRFNQETCGIMSIRHDPMQNPWRRLIWPMVHQSKALFHAIASMACFHLSRYSPEMRKPGLAHVNQSMALLRSHMNTISVEAALTVCLALAFSESWDRHTSTGIDHIKGAKQLIAKVLADDNFLRSRSKEQRERLTFLCKTWLYVDVIARLTSVDEDTSNGFEFVASKIYSPLLEEVHIDPLMGCASSLFPIIGRVANLVRRVCKKPCSSLAMISQGVDLKKQLEEWVPPSHFDQNVNSTADILDSLQTAEAYRKATLLYLHQAVPEIQDFPTPAELGQQILSCLATVPLSSGTVIIHIYPLLAAGCEAESAEDRQWVLNRWEAMSQRMAIGNVDRCAEVVKEVWERRDAAISPMPNLDVLSSNLRRDSLLASPDVEFDPFGGPLGSSGEVIDPSLLKNDVVARQSRLPPAIPKQLDYEHTVRGSLHWVGVMKDWNWEGMSCSIYRVGL